MTDSSTTTVGPDLHFESPDGRIWSRDVDHQSGPRVPMTRPLFDEAFRAGTEIAFERLGAPLSHGEACHVHGWSYTRMVPAGVPDRPGSSALPPAPVLKVLTRLAPELRRRERIARAAVSEERWMDDVEAWWRERPVWEQRFRSRQDVAPERLDDEGLAGEITATAEEGQRMLQRHFELMAPAMAVGMALVAGVDHGIDPLEVAGALRGSSSSTEAPTRHLGRIARLLDDAGAGRIASLDDARAASIDADRLIDEYLGTYGWRLLAADLAAPTLAETPDVLVRAIRSARDGDPAERADEPIAELAWRVATDDRDEFRRLMRNAAEAYETLDDNSSFACWGLGVLRRLMLEAGRRLAASGTLRSADQIWLLEVAEVTAALQDGASVSTAEVDERADQFRAAAEADPPATLGGTPAPPPDPSVFPTGLRTLARAIDLYLGLRFPSVQERAVTGRVESRGRVIATGHGIGDGAAQGRAVVATSVHDALDRLQPGDVLVCPITNPAYNVVFPIAAAVVTEVGGPLGHAAVTARELGIPAVVGIGDLSAVTDGADIVVIGGNAPTG